MLTFIGKQENKKPADMSGTYQSVIRFRGIRVHLVSDVSTEYKIKQVFNWSSSDQARASIFCQGNVQLNGNLASKVYSTYTVTCQKMEKIVGLVVEQIYVLA